jgi:hypothetical protein
VFYDTNLMAFTTNYFQCYDVPLTNGANTITIYATDLAGNVTTTNINLTVDYSGDTTAPALTVLWPTNGTPIGGGDFTLQARVDDYTATVTASIVNTNGETNTVQGLVERNGLVWVDLPLTCGTNTLTLTATDAAGNATVTNLTVTGNDADLTFVPLTDDQLNQSFVTVTGTVSDASYSVTVNGVGATVSGDPTWKAENVPVSPLGTASLNVVVLDASGHLVMTHDYSRSQSAKIGLLSYSFQSAYTDYSYYTGYYTGTKATDWNYLSGGKLMYANYFGSGNIAYAAGDAGAAALVQDYNFEGGWQNNAGSDIDGTSWQTETKVMIEPAGKAAASGTASYIVQAQVCEEDNDDTSVPVRLLDPKSVQIRGATLTAITNSDGSVWGETLVTAPAGTQVEITPTAAGIPNLSFGLANQYYPNAGAMRLVKTKEDWQQVVGMKSNLNLAGWTSSIIMQPILSRITRSIFWPCMHFTRWFIWSSPRNIIGRDWPSWQARLSLPAWKTHRLSRCCRWQAFNKR